jgi:hypothetical protein
MIDHKRRRPRPMQTVTVQDPSGLASAASEPVKAVTPATVEVTGALPCFGEFECEWALDLADR